MNKKLIVGTAALTTVAVGGYLYYRWVRSVPLDLFLEDETEDKPEPERFGATMTEVILNDMARREEQAHG